LAQVEPQVQLALLEQPVAQAAPQAQLDQAVLWVLLELEQAEQLVPQDHKETRVVPQEPPE
jgi:hypothetical protein